MKASESKLKELMKIKSDDKYDEQSKFLCFLPSTFVATDNDNNLTSVL